MLSTDRQTNDVENITPYPLTKIPPLHHHQ